MAATDTETGLRILISLRVVGTCSSIAIRTAAAGMDPSIALSYTAHCSVLLLHSSVTFPTAATTVEQPSTLPFKLSHIHLTWRVSVTTN